MGGAGSASLIRRKVVLRETAKADMRDLRTWIADQSNARTADEYVSRLKSYLKKLGDVAEVGQRLDVLGPGIRSTNFEGRRRVIFAVQPRSVHIIRVVYSGRDLERVIAETDFDAEH